jgi:malonyl-CoA O-methyltransferase
MTRLAHQESVARRFDAAAATYDAYANVQRDVAARLLAAPPALPEGARILDAGCGTGCLTNLLLRAYPAAVIDAFDASARMVEAARTRLGPGVPVTWHTATFAGFEAPCGYDLVASSAALHWVQPLASTVQGLAARMKPGGHLLAALMVEGTLPELLASRGRVAPAKRPRITLPSADAARDVLGRCRWRRLHTREQCFTEHYPSARAFLQALHAMGLTGGWVSADAAPLVRGELERLVSDYEQHYRDAAGVRATYRVLFVEAQ